MDSRGFTIESQFEVRQVSRPGGCERPHSHSELTITAVTGGTLRLKTGEDLLILEHAKTAVILPNQKHYSEYESTGPESVYVIYLNPDFISWNSNISSMLSGKKMQLDYVLVDDLFFYINFLDLCNFLLGPGPELAKTAKLANWIKNCLAERLKVILTEKKVDSVNDLAEAIKKILDNYPGERAPTDEIANAFKRSKEHCNRIFKAAYKISIQAYFLNLKAHRAKDLLGKSKHDLGTVALESGFYDQSHFSRIFKDIFQMTPDEFRKAMLR